MAGYPEFTHIHLSGKHGVNPGKLESDLDTFYGQCSIFTITEIDNNNAAAKLAEDGWGYYNARETIGQDECAVAWDKGTWVRMTSSVRRLSKHRRVLGSGKKGAYVYACNVLLKHRTSGSKLLVTVAHLPAHVQGRSGWANAGDEWRARKLAYTTAMSGWSGLVKDLVRKHKPNGVLVVADWNLNLKDDWVRDYLRQHWGPKLYDISWKHYPTEGGSMDGGRRIIDASLVRNLDLEDGGSKLMGNVKSSDHRPYKTRLQFSSGRKVDDPEGGDTQKGRAWWGFGDYTSDDTIYALTRAFEDADPEIRNLS